VGLFFAVLLSRAVSGPEAFAGVCPTLVHAAVQHAQAGKELNQLFSMQCKGESADKEPG
jgi:hypothetical protein